MSQPLPMPLPDLAARLDRASQLINQPYALEILNGLADGVPLTAAVLAADPQAVTDAVQLLEQLDLIYVPGSPASRQLILTPRGQKLLEMVG